VTAAGLGGILAAVRERVERLRPGARDLERRAAQAPTPRPFGGRRSNGSVGVIAEVKRRSPSAGAIRATLDAVAHAHAYAAGGAVAISVLTEEAHFGGSLEDLRQVAEAVELPVLRKDFILDELQLLEARAAGAAAVLVIARILSPARLRDLAREARRLGLGVMVEVHTTGELNAALAVEGAAVGVNCRDLDSFAVDLATAERLLPLVPPDVVAVAESGIETRSDVERMGAAGADHVLVGTALTRLAEPGPAVRALGGVPRRQRAGTA
jgi:indole-3-glycerol phosphate synthase